MIRRPARAAALILLAALGGCEVAEAPLVDSKRFYSEPSLVRPGSRLVPWTTLTGWYFNHGGGGGTERLMRTVLGESSPALFLKPIAVSARNTGEGQEVHVLDHTAAAIYRFVWRPRPADGKKDQAEFDRLRTIAEIRSPTDMFVAPSGDIYVSDSDGQKVMRYNAEGKITGSFASAEHLNGPVAVGADEKELRIFVADSFWDRILVFNPAGTPLYLIGERGTGDGQFGNIRRMATGPLGLYVVDGTGRRVQIFGFDGTFITSFGDNSFSDASGIATDDEGRVYVADKFDNRILIFKNRRLLEVFGKYGFEAGQFNSPNGLWYNNGYLYVADTNNGRVQVLRVIPESVIGGN